MQTLLGVEHLGEEDIDQDLHLVQREQLAHHEVDQAVSNCVLLFRLDLPVRLVLLLREVKQSALAHDLVADDSQVAKQVLVVISQLHVVVLILDFIAQETEDALDHDRDDFILFQVALDLEPGVRIDSRDVAHDLQILGADVRHLPVGRGAQLCDLHEVLLVAQVVNRLLMVVFIGRVLNRRVQAAEEGSDAQAAQHWILDAQTFLAIFLLFRNERVLGLCRGEVHFRIIDVVSRSKLFLLKALHHGLRLVALLALIVLFTLSMLLLTLTGLALFLRRSTVKIHLVLHDLLLLYNLILEAAAQIRVLLLRAGVVDRRIAVLTQPVLDFVPLRVQEMQDAFDAILLGEHLVVLFLLAGLLMVHEVRARLVRIRFEGPELHLVVRLYRQVASVSRDDVVVLVVAEILRLIGDFRVRLLEQVCHLMQDAEANVVVRLDALVVLRDGVPQRLEVLTHLGRFNLNRRLYVLNVFSVHLL